MASWSAENATKAYLKTLKMVSTDVLVEGGKEPDAAEFISALAAGNNAQLMVVTCPEAVTLLALSAAAQQTGGRVICIHQSVQLLHQYEHALGQNADNIQFTTGDPQRVIMSTDLHKRADFFVIDCNLDNHEDIIKEMTISRRAGVVLVGYNAMCNGSSWRSSGLNTHLLPIGTGLLVTKIGGNRGKMNNIANYKGGYAKKSQWVVKIDKFTGEEHVFRIRNPYGNYKEIED